MQMDNQNAYNKVRVLPYSTVSGGARDLANALGGKRIRLKGSKYVPKDNDLVVNWGNSFGFPSDSGATVLNGDSVKLHNATNKLTFFQCMRG